MVVPSRDPEPGHRFRVLLVEDDAAIRRSVERAARVRPELQLRTVASVAEAQTLLGRESFDLVVADFQLGETTSAELVRDLHARGVEVRVVTGAPERAREALGALVRIFAKPADLDVLLSPEDTDAGPSRSATRLKGRPRPAALRSKAWWTLGGFVVGLAVGVVLTWMVIGTG